MQTDRTRSPLMSETIQHSIQHDIQQNKHDTSTAHSSLCGGFQEGACWGQQGGTYIPGVGSSPGWISERIRRGM